MINREKRCPVTAEPTTADLLLAWDRTRPRSQQAELGWSEVGGCRRRAGYRLAGTPPTNPGGSVQAVLGTAIHHAVQDRLAETAGPNDLVEHEVEFAGILGHIDRYEAATATVVDVKTTSDRWLSRIQKDGPPRSALWQINGYAAALISQGRSVRRVVLDYIARDTGRVWRWSAAPDTRHVRDALEWLRAVRSVPVAELNRDYEPDGPWCGHCPFYDTCWDGAVTDRDKRSVLLVEQPGDAARWVRQLDQARADKADAARREAEAKGVLDGLRPNEEGESDVLDVGDPELGVQFEVTTSWRLDTAQVEAEYAETGGRPPRFASRSTKVKLVPLEEA